MNLVMVSALLLATLLTIRPTLIYGSKGLASGGFGSKAGSGKKHSTLSAAKSKASLVMQFESGDVYVRKARGAGGNLPAAVVSEATAEVEAGAVDPDISRSNSNNNSAGRGGGKRGKNNNNKKSNKNIMTAASMHSQSTSVVGKKHLDKKLPSGSAANLQHNAGHHNNNNNNKGKQRQLLKSQQHQNHGKRAGNTKSASTASGQKSLAGASEKTQSTCRYAKSAWTECDSETNSKSRTLTLKKGENNCLPTRTIQKKCKKVCRYEKGSWSECTNGLMTRQDKLKSTGTMDSSSCDAVRSIDKICNPGGGKGAKAANRERKNKEKATRRIQKEA